MAFNGAHAFFTLGFLLLMASGGSEARNGMCGSPSGSYRGPCLSNGLCATACHAEYYKGDKSKPFTDGHCSFSIDGGDDRFFPRCICTIFCGPPSPPADTEQDDDPERRRHHHHHHHHPPPPPEQELI